MSFWPFSNTYGNSSHLHKFLDSIVDFSTVTVNDLLDDRNIQSELLDELKTISSKSLKSNNFSFVPSLQNDHGGKNGGLSANSDNLSVSSSNAESNSGANSSTKTAREQKLLELLLQPHILNGFLDYIVQSVDFFNEQMQEEESENDPQPEDTGEGQANDNSESAKDKLHRCIQCSAEILSTDLWVIANRIIETPSLMGKLWSVLSMSHLYESSPAIAYLIQILDHLMDTNCIELINFVRRQEDLVDTFLGKVDIPILMDFFLKIIQTDKPESPTGIISVLSRQGLIPKLIDILKPVERHDKSTPFIFSNPDDLFRQTSTTEFVKALVTISSNASLAVDLDTNIGPNELTRELASPTIIRSMLNDIILVRIPSPSNPDVFTANKFGIANCVSILIELIRKNNSDYDLHCGTYSVQNETDNASEVNVHMKFLWLKDFDQNPPSPRDPIHLGDLLEIFSDNLDALVELMDMEATAMSKNGTSFGITRFKLSELIAELLHCSNMILLNSKKIAYLMRIRDEVRSLQCVNIETALKETITGMDDEDSDTEPPFVSDITSGMSEVSLDSNSMREGRKSNRDSLQSITASMDDDIRIRNMLQELEYEESEDDEPSVSAENPFVCEERDQSFRADPCTGDYFKIKLIDSNMLHKIVQQFTEFPWHNFFHNVVFDLFQQVFNGKLNSYNSFLIVELFRPNKCNIADIIVKTFRVVEEPRPGYTGHLILVSEEVVKFTSLYKPSLLSPVIVDAVGSEDWQWFVSEVLLKTRELYNVILGTDPDYAAMDEDKYEFESSTVGFMDMDSYQDSGQKQKIILGDSTNHDEFVSSSSAPAPDEDSDDLDMDSEEDEESEVADHEPPTAEGIPKKKSPRKILDVPIKSMSPNSEFKNKDMLYEDYGESKLTLGGPKDDFPGSDSSEEDNDNQLYRVAKNK